MTDCSTSARTAEPAVGDERNGFIKTHTRKRTGGGEHFTHTGTTLWTFVADDHDIAIFNLTAENRVDSLFFAVKHTRTARMHQHLLTHGTAFYHTTVGG